MDRLFQEVDSEPHLRLIPELEKMPRVVRFAESILGKVCLVAVFAFVLSVPEGPDPWLIGGLFFLGLTRLRSDVKIICFSLLLPFTHAYQKYLSTWGPLPKIQTVSKFREALESIGEPAILLGQLACRLAVIFALLVLYFLAKRTDSWRGAKPLILFWLVFLAAALLLPRESWIYPFGWNFVIYFSACVFGFSYFLVSRSAGSQALTGLGMGLQCLATGASVPVVEHPGAFSVAAPKAQAICQLKALKLLVWSKILDAVRCLLSHCFFSHPLHFGVFFQPLPSLRWPNYGYMGNAAYNDLHLPIWQIWPTVLLNTVGFVLWLSYASGYSIAVLRLAGIYVPRFVVRPYLAKTFNGYFRRLLFFYSEVLIYFFFFPAKKWLRSGRLSRRQRTLVALFIAISFGGQLLHVFRNVEYFMLFGTTATVRFFLSQIPYFTLVALVTCVSTAGIVPRLTAGRLPFRANIVIIFIMHAMLLTLISANPQDDWHGHWVLLRSLFFPS